MATVVSEQLLVEIPVQLPLAEGLAQRAGDTVIGLLAVAAGRLTGAFFLTAAVAPHVYGNRADVGARAPLVAFAAACFALGWFGRRSLRSALARDARLVVTPDAVSFHHRGMLRARVDIDRDEVRAVAIDDGNGASKFPVEAAAPGGRPIGWLWQRPYWRLSIPSLARNTAAPNVALIFRHPVDFPGRHKRGGWFLKWRGPNGPERAVAVRVKDLDAARRTFERWGAVRPLCSDDLAACLPRRRSHRTRP